MCRGDSLAVWIAALIHLIRTKHKKCTKMHKENEYRSPLFVSVDKKYAKEYDVENPLRRDYNMNLCAELMKKDLDAKNMNFTTGTTKKGDSVIEFPYKGKTAKMFFCGDEGHYLSIYVVYEEVPKDKTVDTIIACNALNVQYKWVTFYVDDDNDVVLHLDAILSPATAAEEAFELLVRTLNIGDEAKPIIMKAIYA